MIFEQVGTHQLPDEKLVATEYRHPLGLRHIHIPSTFPEIGYALVFPTAVKNDTGIPHILEHLTMCGSDRYRQKSPFFSMLDRTVAHDLNAHTARAATTYHFATTDPADYINLARVYTDLAFNPLLRRSDFNREGWRMEQDEAGKPKLNGVVLNEMLGAFSDPDTHIREAINRAIDPDAPESRISGGHPLSIPALSYEDLRAFHDAHYSPEAAILVTTGKDVPVGALHAILDEALVRRAARHRTEKRLGKADVSITAGADPVGLWDEKDAADIHGRKARVVQVPGETGEPSQTFWIWEADWASAPIEELRDQMIVEVLFNAHNSPAIEKLQDDMGGEVAVQLLHGLSRGGGHIGLMVSIDGVDPERAAALGNQIENALDEAVREGVSDSAWKQSLARVEMETLLPGPLHTHAYQMAEALLSGLPFGQDHNNREAIAQLRLEGVPTSEDCARWWKRWRRAPVITTVSDPEVMNRWRERLMDMAQVKWDAGMRVATLEKDTFVDEDKNLPIVDADRLNPVAASVAGLWVSPARAAEGWTSHLPSDEENAQLDQGAWLTSGHEGITDLTDIGDGHRYACHRHVRCAEDDPVRKATLEFDVTDLSAETLDTLRVYTLLAAELGRGKKGHLQTRNEEAQSLVHSSLKMGWQAVGGIRPENLRLTLLLRVGSSRADGLGGPSTCSWLAKILTEDIDEDEKCWSSACRRLVSSLRQEQEEVIRAEEITAAVAFVDAQKQRTLDPGRLDRTLQILQAGVDRPDLLRAAVQKSWVHLRQHGSVRVGTIGDRATLAGGELLARMLARTDPEFGTYTSWQRPGVQSGHSLHVVKSGAGNMCERFFAVPELSVQPRLEITLLVAASLIDPLLHKRIREEGGAYGARMSVRGEAISLHSYRDPNTDTTYATYDLVHDFLAHSCAEADPGNLARAKLQVAQRLLNPGSGSRYRKVAITRHNQGYGRERDSELLAILKSVSWGDVAAAADYIDPARTPYVNVAIGPDRPKRFDRAPIKEKPLTGGSTKKPKGSGI